MTIIMTVRVSSLVAPVTFTRYIPGIILAIAVRFSCAEPEPLIVAVLSVALRPVGVDGVSWMASMTPLRFTIES